MADSDPSGLKLLRNFGGITSAVSNLRKEVEKLNKEVAKLKTGLSGLNLSSGSSLGMNPSLLNVGKGSQIFNHGMGGAASAPKAGPSMPYPRPAAMHGTFTGAAEKMGMTWKTIPTSSFGNKGGGSHPPAGGGGTSGGGGPNWMKMASYGVKGATYASTAMNTLLPSVDSSMGVAETLWTAAQAQGGGRGMRDYLKTGFRDAMPTMLNPNSYAQVAAVTNPNMDARSGVNIARSASFYGSMGMDEGSAAAAMVSMYSGSTSAQAFQHGLLMTDPKTGRRKSPEEVTKQLYAQLGVSRYKDAGEATNQLYAGPANRLLDQMGFNEDAKSLIKTNLLKRYTAEKEGKPFDINERDKADENPFGARGELGKEESNLTATNMDSNVRGTNAATKATKDFTTALDGATKALGPIGQFAIGSKAGMDGIMSGPLGSVIRALTGGLASGTGGSGILPGIGGSGIKNMTPGVGGSGIKSGGSSSMGGAALTLGSAGGGSALYFGGSLPGSIKGVASNTAGGSTSSTAGGSTSSGALGGSVGGGSSPTGGKGARFIYQQLLAKGYSPAGAAAILGNLEIESGFNPHSTGDGGTAHGIAQWRGDRWTNLKAFAKKSGRSEWDVGAEVDFLVKELGSYKGLNKMLLDPKTDAGKAARQFDAIFERSDGSARDARAKAAEKYLKRYGSHSEGAWDVPKDQAAKLHSGEMVLPAEIAHSVREVLAGKRAGGGGGGTVNVYVTLNSASRSEAERLVTIVGEEVKKRANLDSLASV